MNHSKEARSGKRQAEVEQTTREDAPKVTFFTVLASVFASFFGVQSHRNRKRDFESGKFWHFFTAGLIFVLVFLLLVWAAVQYLLATTPTGG